LICTPISDPRFPPLRAVMAGAFTFSHIGRSTKMAQQTKADRKAAAKKGVSTKQRMAAKKSGADAKRSAKSSGSTAMSGAKSLAESVLQAGKAVSSRVRAARTGR
jgi:hypothetical protein